MNSVFYKVKHALKFETREKIVNFLSTNIVTIIFVFICALGIKFSKQPVGFIVNELIVRISRNAILVLSLIIPVLVGLGLNFSIVLGAMAGQIALILITHWRIEGAIGILMSILVSTPVAILFGYLTGKLLNKTKGQEMITGMILGYFSTGIYILIFLVLVGSIIPMKDPVLLLSNGVGIKNTIELQDKTKYALDNLVKLSLYNVVWVMYIMTVVFTILKILYNIYKCHSNNKPWKKVIKTSIGQLIILTIIFLLIIANKNINMIMKFADVPLVPLLITALVYFFIKFISTTKMGQDFKAVGQSMSVASAAGINVDKIRITAIIISTFLAAVGQIIFIQNIGNFSTYSSHEQVGTFAIAALLVGGASIEKATVNQALIGTLLFHTLFIVSPIAGKNIFNNAQIGEFFRVFLSYAVIAISLGLHATRISSKKTGVKSTHDVK